MALLNLKPLKFGWPPMRLRSGQGGGEPDPDPVAPGLTDRITLLEVTDTSMLVTWGDPDDGGSPITRYVVQYRKDNAGPSTIFNPATKPQLIEGLEPDTMYGVRVRCDNAVGAGALSAFAEFRTTG